MRFVLQSFSELRQLELDTIQKTKVQFQGVVEVRPIKIWETFHPRICLALVVGG